MIPPIGTPKKLLLTSNLLNCSCWFGFIIKLGLVDAENKFDSPPALRPENNPVLDVVGSEGFRPNQLPVVVDSGGFRPNQLPVVVGSGGFRPPNQLPVVVCSGGFWPNQLPVVADAFVVPPKMLPVGLVALFMLPNQLLVLVFDVAEVLFEKRLEPSESVLVFVPPPKIPPVFALLVLLPPKMELVLELPNNPADSVFVFYIKILLNELTPKRLIFLLSCALPKIPPCCFVNPPWSRPVFEFPVRFENKLLV